MTALTTIGDLEPVCKQNAAMLAQAERPSDRFWLAGALWKNAIEFRLMGEWTLARDYSGRGLEVPLQDPALLTDRVMLEFQTGNLVEAEDYLDRLVGRFGLQSSRSSANANLDMVTSLVAQISVEVGQSQVGEVAVQAVLASPAASPNIALRARIGLAMQANQRRDIQDAGEGYSALPPCRT